MNILTLYTITLISNLEVREQLQTLDKGLRDVVGNDIFGDATIDMCLVSDLVMLAKFKTP